MHHRPTKLSACVLGAALLTGVAAALAAPISDAYRGVLEIVERGGDWERHDFARIALDAMANEHEEVLGKTREDAPRDGDRKKLRRWMAAAMPYLDSLYAAIDALDLAEQVDVVVGGEGTVQVTVDEHFVVVSPLDIRNPAHLENAIAYEFCQLHDCDFATGLGVPPGRWDFSQHGGSGYATASGVRCLFSGTRDRAGKERICRELGDALVALVKRLHRWRTSGMAIDLAAFEVIVEGPATLSLRLNNAGDWLMVDDPALTELPSVVELAAPWLVDRLEGGTTELVIPHADLLLDAVLRK